MISVIVPIYNEEENIKILHEKITSQLIDNEYEIIYIDDGSKDNSFEILKEIKDEHTKIIKFKKNFGQTAAMQAGIDESKGDIIITLDADLQNDPKDIPKLISKYNEGFDLVSGWRKKRLDDITRTFPSRIANFLISKITKTDLHDTGCTLKAYNGNILRKLNLFADHHRFIPAIFAQYSDKITEVEVEHNKRIYGKSKYNILRIFRVIVDLIAISYWKNYRNKPMYFWGNLSILLFFLSILAILFFIFSEDNLIFIIFCTVFFTNGILTLAIGLLFEAALRTNLDKNNAKIYTVDCIL